MIMKIAMVLIPTATIEKAARNARFVSGSASQSAIPRRDRHSQHRHTMG
ncbi:hypothetical protein [Sphingobium yanoikuyae]|nr:hypothetical protein [Sphingobium yanoikuyae]WBQ15975.1 hypothetical protein PAE53_18990 [Sphingobium yanoikuyae]